MIRPISKQDHIYFCSALACKELLNQDENTVYTGNTKTIHDLFLSNIDRTLKAVPGFNNPATKKVYLRTIRAFDKEIKIGNAWIPLLLCNEIMAHFAHRKEWKAFSFSDIYDHLDGLNEDTQSAMYDKAARIMSAIQGQNRKHDKIRKTLALKRMRIQAESKASV